MQYQGRFKRHRRDIYMLYLLSQPLNVSQDTEGMVAWVVDYIMYGLYALGLLCNCSCTSRQSIQVPVQPKDHIPNIQLNGMKYEQFWNCNFLKVK